MNTKSFILYTAFTLAITAQASVMDEDVDLGPIDIRPIYAKTEEPMTEEVKTKPLAKKPSACGWEKVEHKKGKCCWDDYADCDYNDYADCPYDDDRCEDKKVVIPDCPEKKCPSWDINWKGCSTCA